MSYIALYRKWRPLLFEDVVEQGTIVKTLKNSVKSGRIAHAYLFCGSRGTGKTSVAKIFARAINCISPNDGDPCNVCSICKGVLTGQNMDVIEIDAASNNGVDNVREIRDEVIYTPTQSKYKVYIIDEVHMLSSGAFNALLKTLEEPPAHAIFILATTEPHKLPATILSRCQRYDFRRISVQAIAERLHKIAKDSGVDITPDGATLIAKVAEGGLRDAISILDQCISEGSSNIDVTDICASIGLVQSTLIQEAANSVLTKDSKAIFSLVGQVVEQGKDLKHFVSDLVLYFRDLLLLKLKADVQSLSYPLLENPNELSTNLSNLDEDLLMSFIKELSLLENGIRWARNPRIMVEVGLIKASERKFSTITDELAERISELERKLTAGHFAPGQATTSSYGEVPKPQALQSAQSTSQKGSVKTSASSSDAAHVRTSNHSSPNSAPSTPVPFWNEVITEARSMGRMLVYTSLLDSTASFLSEHAILIIPSNSFNRLSLSKAENIEVLKNILGKRLHHEVHIKIGNSPAENAEEHEDSALLKAREFAKKANIPFDVVDE